MDSCRFFVYSIVLISFAIITSILVDSNKEEFNPYIDYSRVYPGTFSYRHGYGPYYRPFNDSWPGPVHIDGRRQVRHNPGYRDYHYIPKHQYLNRWVNAPNGEGVPNECTTPPITSEYCVKVRTEHTGNLDKAIFDCTTPPRISESCPLLHNRGL